LAAALLKLAGNCSKKYVSSSSRKKASHPTEHDSIVMKSNPRKARHMASLRFLMANERPTKRPHRPKHPIINGSGAATVSNSHKIALSNVNAPPG
jgi:hypothetical protein